MVTFTTSISYFPPSLLHFSFFSSQFSPIFPCLFFSQYVSKHFPLRSLWGALFPPSSPPAYYATALHVWLENRCTPPKTLAKPYFANWRYFLHEMLTKVIWLIKKLNNSLGLLIFCGGCADLMPFSTYLCKKKSIFIKNWEIWELFISSTAS